MRPRQEFLQGTSHYPLLRPIGLVGGWEVLQQKALVYIFICKGVHVTLCQPLCFSRDAYITIMRSTWPRWLSMCLTCCHGTCILEIAFWKWAYLELMRLLYGLKNLEPSKTLFWICLKHGLMKQLEGQQRKRRTLCLLFLFSLPLWSGLSRIWGSWSREAILIFAVFARDGPSKCKSFPSILNTGFLPLDSSIVWTYCWACLTALYRVRPWVYLASPMLTTHWSTVSLWDFWQGSFQPCL